jgi:GTPase
MKFVDIAKITLKSGNGGPGHISFRREKFVPKGGPDGGNGGKGGSVIIIADKRLNTLMDFRYKREYIAMNGVEGGKSRKSGKDGENIIIRLPVGTLIKKGDTEEVIIDLNDDGQEFVIAEGGIGGRGNAEFATPTNQAPRFADPGRPGKEMEITLELKLLADVGLVGFPNAGKSTLISVISASKPKIADYPFTTLTPNLGIVRVDNAKSYTMADIPGLIEGASDGKGLGIQFLRHVERSGILAFLIDSTSEHPKEDYQVLLSELLKYNPDMNFKTRIICFSKTDLIDDETKAELGKVDFGETGLAVIFISAVTHAGLEELKWLLWNEISKLRNDGF